MAIFNSSNGASFGSDGGGVPSGLIAMWSGSEVPEGWYLCNGENGTPDLRGRFVLGANETHALAETGGDETVTLTVEQMPMHNHQSNMWVYGSGSTGARYLISDTKGNQLSAYYTGTEGSSEPHNNMPPYYVLAFIMKA